MIMDGIKRQYPAPDCQELSTLPEMVLATSGTLEEFDDLMDYELY